MTVLTKLPALYRLLGPHRGLFGQTLAVTLLTALWSMVTFLAASALIQSVVQAAGIAWSGFPGESIFARAGRLLEWAPREHRVLVGFAATAASMVGGGLVSLAVLAFNIRFLSRFMVHLQTLCFEGMLAYRMDFHDETRRSQLNQLVIVEVRACHSLMKEFTTLCGNFFQVAVHAAVMLLLSPVLTAVFFAAGLGAWLVTQRLNRLNQRWSRAALRSRNDLMAVAHETLYGIKPVKVLGAQARMRERFGRSSAESIRLFGRVSLLVNGQSTLMRAFGLVAVTLIIAASVALGGRVPPASVVLFLFVATGLIPAAAAAAREFGIMHETVASVDAVTGFLAQAPVARERDGALERPRLLGEALRFEDVWLDYEGRPGILRGVSLTIRRGERVGVVGASGSGKTSLVNLVPRLYDPARGRITVDGTDLRELRLAFLRGRIGLLSQDVFVFNATVRENLLMGRPDASEADLVAAARLAHALEFIEALPGGWDTPVGDRGVKLSGGQRQRLNIAQVVLKDPEILILDEATSALDSESEALVQEAIDRLSRDRTVITVAHRLSTLRTVDRLLVLDRGELVEEGSWQELVRRGGAFARMWEMQGSAVG